MKKIIVLLALALLGSCKTANVPQNSQNGQKAPFVWEGANLYFLLTDRFQNGNPNNDVNFGRTEKAAVLRGFEGGDLRGIIQKMDEGYFNKLGINAIWMTPFVEQIHGATDEGTGKTYAFHGYWAKDWTAIDPNFGTKADLKELVEKAHKQGIRIVMDVVINHTGPVTEKDEAYPSDWVRTSPQCKYTNYENTTACTLVKNLPDVLTESNSPVQLPQILVDKWKQEGRYDQEVKTLDEFFAKTGFPRAPKYYFIKWLTDYIKTYGIDGFRVDTVKHVNEDTWKDLQKVCQDAFDEYKKNNPTKVLDNNNFFTVGELYGYGISQKREYSFGDRKVNYFNNGFESLINFDFKGDANKPYEQLFSNYSEILNTDLKGFGVMNYISSHDDSWPYDKERNKTYESAAKLLLAPGISQIYYGDESARPLIVAGAEGDANLRSNMNWNDEQNNAETKKILLHWQKLGKFRHDHPSVGAGVHQMISSLPFWFSRKYSNVNYADKVVVGLDLASGEKTADVSSVFADGTKLNDAYSGKTTIVKNGKATVDTPFNIVLFEIAGTASSGSTKKDDGVLLITNPFKNN